MDLKKICRSKGMAHPKGLLVQTKKHFCAGYSLHQTEWLEVPVDIKEKVARHMTKHRPIVIDSADDHSGRQSVGTGSTGTTSFVQIVVQRAKECFIHKGMLLHHVEGKRG